MVWDFPLFQPGRHSRGEGFRDKRADKEEDFRLDSRRKYEMEIVRV